jgi:general stress protein YciG
VHIDDQEGQGLSDRDKQLAREIGRHAGQVVTARIIDLVTDREFAEKVTSTYAEQAQRIVGAAVIRFIFWVLGVAMLIAAWKTGVLDKVGDFFSHRP